MKLMHFSNAPVTAVAQRPHQRDGMKPNGFWVSDESEGSHGWSSWCRDEEFGLGSNAYRVELATDANVLVLSAVVAIRAFHASYAVGHNPHYVDWARVAKQWQGILISPYQWELRLSDDVHWYYSWDCASGCIWDAAAVESIALVSETRQAVS